MIEREELRSRSSMKPIAAAGRAIADALRRVQQFGARNIWMQMHRLDRASQVDPNPDSRDR